MSIEQARATEAFRILEPVVTPRLNRGLEYGLVLYAFLLPFAKLTHLLEYFFLTLFAIWVIREASKLGT